MSENTETNENDIVPNIVQLKRISMIVGAPNTGKSFYALKLAAAIANGMPFTSELTQAAPVVFIDFQHWQIELMERAVDVSGSSSVTLRSCRGENVDNVGLLKMMTDFANANGGSTVFIIDGFHRAQPKGFSEKNATHWNSLMSGLEEFAVQTNSAIVLVDPYWGTDCDPESAPRSICERLAEHFIDVANTHID